MEAVANRLEAMLLGASTLLLVGGQSSSCLPPIFWTHATRCSHAQALAHVNVMGGNISTSSGKAWMFKQNAGSYSTSSFLMLCVLLCSSETPNLEHLVSRATIPYLQGFQESSSTNNKSGQMAQLV